MEFVSHPWVAPDVIEKRKYQEYVVASAVNGNTLVVLPTGLGKTPIAALVAAHRLQKDATKKILFLAPTRPLVEQHCQTFGRCMKTGLEMAVITGMNEPGERRSMYQKSHIVFSTPQTVRNDVQNSVLSLEDFSLCIFDEAHRAAGNYAYPYIAKAYTEQSKNPLILALTASPGVERSRIDEVKKMLYIKNVEIRSRDDEDVRPYVQEVQHTRTMVELPETMKTMQKYLTDIKDSRVKKLISWDVVSSPYVSKTQILKLQESLAKRKTGYSFAVMSILAEIMKIDHALILLETQCIAAFKKYLDKLAVEETRAVERLLREPSMKSIMALASEMSKNGLEHPKMGKLKEIVADEISKDKFSRIMVFAQYRDTIEKIHDELKALKNVAPVQFIGQAKKSGKGLTQKEQMQILNEFKMGFYNVLVASSVGEEGLDVAETNVVIFYEPTSSAIRKIQRSGRTARTQKGKVIIMITKGTRDETYHWVEHSRERKMNKILYGMSNSLRSYT